MKRTLVLSSIVIAGVVAVAGRALLAQPPAGPKVANIEKVKDNLYMVTGGGGNTAVFVTANGVVWSTPSWPTGASRSWTR
jgi:hypothetical protein